MQDPLPVAAMELARRIADLVEHEPPEVGMTAMCMVFGAQIASLLPPTEVPRALALIADGTREMAHRAMLTQAERTGALQ